MYGPARVIAGEDDVFPTDQPADGQPAELQREDENQHWAGDERGNANQRQRAEHRAGVDRRVVPHRGEAAQPDAGSRGNAECDETEHHRDRQAAAKDLAHGAVAVFQRRLEIAL